MEQHDTNKNEKDILLKESLNYIKKEQMYLLWSGIFPAYSIGVNVVNFGFIILAITNNWILIRRLVDIVTPLIIFLFVTIFSIVQFMFLRKWKEQLTLYQIRKNSKKTPKPRVSLTDMFYSIITYMEKTRVIFILLNIVAVIYLIWGFDFFVIGISLSLSLEKFAKITWYLNAVSVFVLLMHVGYQWYHFIKWNKKLNKIDKLEKDIATELDL